jgi:hypothetical protein
MVDPLTLHPSSQIIFERLNAAHRFKSSRIHLAPLAHNNHPFRFIAIGSDRSGDSIQSTVYLVSFDFNRLKALKHPDMKRFPQVKQENQRIFVWSADRILYVYEIGDGIEATTLIGRIECESEPTDVIATSNPDIIYVGCKDFTVHALLGKACDIVLRLPDATFSAAEKVYGPICLGPMLVSRCRRLFSEMTCLKCNGPPFKLAAFRFSDQLTLLVVVYATGHMGTFWFYNAIQPVQASNFDEFQYGEVTKVHDATSAQYLANVSGLIEKREAQLSLFETITSFDGIANHALLNNLFNPSSSKISLVKMFVNANIRVWFPFLPEVPPKTSSCYEVFHYLTRIGLLPSTLSEFSAFLQRFAPEELKRRAPGLEAIVSTNIPVKTSGPYRAIATYQISLTDLERIVDVLDPLLMLHKHMSRHKIADTYRGSTCREQWFGSYRRDMLKKRLSYLALMEDLVKLETMNRIQAQIQADFKQHQSGKVPAVTEIEIKPRTLNYNTSRLNFSSLPNRNPLLDEKRHQSIYHSVSQFMLYGRDRFTQVGLVAWHIPSSIFTHSLRSHLQFTNSVAVAIKQVSSNVDSVCGVGNSMTQIVVTEGSRALPLSHCLSIHSFLGATQKLVQAARTIMTHVLMLLHQLHKARIILRTVYPENILLTGSTENPVIFGNVCDCQRLSGHSTGLCLPFPEKFKDPANPFLPPEYFHEHPRRFTAAFDIWQVGMTLLYLLTGFMPTSYGTELLSHVDEEARIPRGHRVRLPSDEGQLSQPLIYPRVIFFYDWLKGFPVVGQSERSTGENGEGYFQTSNPGVPASILELNNYRLHGFVNPIKLSNDDSRAFVEIIASCLQVDPEKRPTAEQLLKTAPFGQTSQANERYIEQYTRKPHPNVFVAQFFVPILGDLNDESFPFAMGMISALLFREQPLDEDQRFVFPLDLRANERVVTSLFQMKFMDVIVRFILKRLSCLIKRSDVYPTLSFQSVLADTLMQFFARFLKSIEHGSGPLICYTDEVIMSLLGFFAANPFLRHESHLILRSPAELAEMAVFEVSNVFLFTFAKAKAMIRYVLESSLLIRRDIHPSPEHNEICLDQFMPFSEAVHAFAHAICGPIDKPRAYAIKSLLGLWQNGTSLPIIRLFVDFSVPQKIVQCYSLNVVRAEASVFICSAYRAIHAKTYDATMKLLQACIRSPIIFLHAAIGIRKSLAGDDSCKLSGIELSRNVFFGDSSSSVLSLIIDDCLASLIELGRDTSYRNLLSDSIDNGSVWIYQVISSSESFQQALRMIDLPLTPKIDYRMAKANLSLDESILFAKHLLAALFHSENDEAIQLVPEFIVKALQMTLKESDLFANRKGKPDSRGRKTKDVAVAVPELCDILLNLFNILCRVWRRGVAPAQPLFDYLKQIFMQDIPSDHLAINVHQLIWRMLHSYLRDVRPCDMLNDFDTLWSRALRRDFQFLSAAVDKDTMRVLLMSRYPVEKQLRCQLFRVLVRSPLRPNILSLLQFLVDEMLYSKTELKFDASAPVIKACRFPVRFEAVEMICWVLEKWEKWLELARQLMKELLVRNFVESERKLTEQNDDCDLVQSSVRLLTVTTQCLGIGGETIHGRGKDLLHSLLSRFTRPLMDLSKFQANEETKRLASERRIRSAASMQEPSSPVAASGQRAEPLSPIGPPAGARPRPMSAFVKRHPASSSLFV